MFEVGQRVVCVDAKIDPGNLPAREVTDWIAPRLGAVYTISGVGAPRNVARYGSQPVVWLAELKNGNDRGYLARRFEPLPKKSTSIEVFQRMLLPNAEPVK